MSPRTASRAMALGSVQVIGAETQPDDDPHRDRFDGSQQAREGSGARPRPGAAGGDEPAGRPLLPQVEMQGDACGAAAASAGGVEARQDGPNVLPAAAPRLGDVSAARPLRARSDSAGARLVANQRHHHREERRRRRRGIEADGGSGDARSHEAELARSRERRAVALEAARAEVRRRRGRFRAALRLSRGDLTAAAAQMRVVGLRAAAALMSRGQGRRRERGWARLFIAVVVLGVVMAAIMLWLHV